MKVPTVTAILLNSQRHVLLQQRDEKPGLAFGGYWTLPGGKVERGEKPDDAIRRELMEELGLVVPLTQWKAYERPHQSGSSGASFVARLLNVTIIQYIYTGQTDRDIASLTPSEGQDWRFFAAADVAALPVAYGFDALIREYFSAADTEHR
ncbi:MAG: NUDIX domain-containing protein [Chloroflexota bacterium]|nr:NUDIX domain-containing protein [Chloroflexota bacterium]